MNSHRIVYTEGQLKGLIRHAGSKTYLSTQGLPAQNVLFRAEPSPHILDVPEPPMSYLIIGRIAAGLLIGLDPDSGEVVAINHEDRDRAWHANADLEGFVSSVQEFADRSPFYKGRLTTKQLEDSALALRSRLAEIDRTSLRDENGFWETLIFDVGLGDYSGEG